MPTFRTTPSSSLTGSIKRLLASGGSALTPLQEMQADEMAAKTAQSQSLAEKARLEAEALRAQQARLNDPALRMEYAARASGVSLPDAERLDKNFRGVRERPSQLGGVDFDDEGNAMPDVTYAKPEGLGPVAERAFHAAMGAGVANLLGAKGSNAAEITQATENLHQNAVMQAVQAAIGRGDMQTASAMSQGAKPGTQIKLFDNIESTGATFAPATGSVQADPNAQPGNALLRGTIDKALADKRRADAAAAASHASAAASRAHAGLYLAQTENEKKKPTPTAASFKDVTTLRKEFNDQPEVKAYRDVLPIVEAARTTPDTRSGDIQIAYAVGKILDPASVVREGELKLVGNAATVMEKFMGELRTLTQGKGRLTPETRAELLAMLDGAVTQREKAYKATETTYRGIAQQNGFPVDQVIINTPKRSQHPAGKPPAPVNAKGWKLMRDAAGNQAYVSPDGTQFEEVQ